MRCLIDADILAYEIASSGQMIDEDGELAVKHIDSVTKHLAEKVKLIEDLCWADEPSTFYFTPDPKLVKAWNKANRPFDPPLEFKPNFRPGIATIKPYKGHRRSEKPIMFDALRAYMVANYDCVIADGMEADDAICIELAKGGETIACTRDKDLRMVNGEHFGWETTRQPQFGPKEVSYLGEVDYVKKECVGEGIKFFYAQLIMGDSVDNIQGIPRKGAKAAYDTIVDAETEEECFKRVRELYEAYYGEDWREPMLENGRLLWMIRELNEDGSPKMWEIPEYD